MVRAIHELQDAGVEPDVWKIEGLDARADCGKVLEAARRGGRDKVSCIVLGRGEDDQKVREWLATAAAVPGFIGFAVGRTVFWDPLVQWRAGKRTREAGRGRGCRGARGGGGGCGRGGGGGGGGRACPALPGVRGRIREESRRVKRCRDRRQSNPLY